MNFTVRLQKLLEPTQRAPLIYDLSTATERQSTHYRPTDQLTMINRSTLNPHTDQLTLEFYRTLTKITRTYSTRTTAIRIIFPYRTINTLQAHFTSLNPHTDQLTLEFYRTCTYLKITRTSTQRAPLIYELFTPTDTYHHIPNTTISLTSVFRFISQPSILGGPPKNNINADLIYDCHRPYRSQT